MTCQEIIMELKSKADEKYKTNVARMGIPEEYITLKIMEPRYKFGLQKTQ